jgi:hypothetical protein
MERRIAYLNVPEKYAGRSISSCQSKGQVKYSPWSSRMGVECAANNPPWIKLLL